MKFILFIPFLLGFQLTCRAQPYPCEASDSVLAVYRDDADRMAIGRAFQNGSTWMDSVNIDPGSAQTAMSALVAVYNLTSPERDTVVDLLDIHIYPTMPLRAFVISADSSLEWVRQLEAGNIPTGNSALDALMQQYDVIAVNTMNWPIGPFKLFTFTTGTNWNLLPLADLFEQIPGVVYCSVSGAAGDGDRITDSVHTDHVELTYAFGWEDCPAGCGAFYYWEFAVQPDCSVDFIGSYGLSPFVNTQVAEVPSSSLRAWPNPVSDMLHVDRSGGMGTLAVYSIDGRRVAPSAILDGGIDVRGLPSGIYLLRRSDRPWDAPVRFEVVH